MPGPKTYTGEDVLELHLHGGRAVISAVLKAIKTLHSQDMKIRYAEAGEFSKRAFQNGRFDLTEIESIRELIDAETEFSRKAAVSGVIGGNKELFGQWRESLKKDVGLLTAIIDFAEDAEIEDIIHIHETVNRDLKRLEMDVRKFLDRNSRTKVLLNGLNMVLLGSPNSGKSSILNQISNDDISIVSSIAGTTRDIINIPLDIGGYKVVISDTAGIRDITSSKDKDIIELEGIKRAKVKAQECDLVTIVISCDNYLELTGEFGAFIRDLKSQDKEILTVLNKIDLPSSVEELNQIKGHIAEELDISKAEIVSVSCLDEINIEELKTELISRITKVTMTSDSDLQNPIMVTSRVEEILENDVLYGIKEYQLMEKSLDDVVLATESLSHAIHGIGRITGEDISVDEVLGVVFENFCVGK
ncbi:hypothetical protein WICPIJ_002370 [Wickerhamomyces pijperi]|uniref:TrmE-type G domain-containing protein n=1 Tax=Wickerhamomyces pijperi TaxID=599730 RepID=A0A9P8Q9W1_WICPI|nr:hypothetical protein WICPIJ_002370 [Wickerhamomyces pijperi]